MLKPLSALALLAFAAAPAAAQSVPQPDRALAGRVAGAPRTCILLRPSTAGSVVPGEAILYREGTRLYVNHPRSGADGLGRDTIIVSRTLGSQLCRGDPVQLIDRSTGFYRDTAILGEFVPYDRAARVRPAR